MKSAIGVIVIVIIAMTIKKAERLYKWAGITFLVLGSLFFVLYVPNEVTFLHQFGSMSGILSLFFILPFMSTIIKVGKYDSVLSGMINRPPQLNSKRLYQRTSIMTYVLTLFLNVATVPVVVGIVKRNVQKIHTDVLQHFFAHSLLRAYALVLLWSPTEVIVASTVDLTGQSFMTLMPTLLGISLFFLLIDWFLHNKRLIEVPVHTESVISTNPKRFRLKFAQMATAILLFLFTLLALNTLLDQSFTFIVTITIVPFTFLWALSMKKSKRFSFLGKTYLKGNANQMHGLFFLYLSAGFFVQVFPYSSWFGYLNHVFQMTYIHGSLFFFYLLIGGCIFVLALVGFPPLVSIAIISPFLIEAIAISPYGVSILLIGVGVCTVMTGPFNVTPTVLAMQLRTNPYTIIKKNLLFGIGYLLFIVTIAYLISVL
ncbi:hypothetical protein [Bacillus sp. JCM 19041]|uniref:hypothetical protein n=1 Tax=Bacillus sp. JCM 19041 TaxID=1460637 RepID=UPI0012E16FBB